MPNKKKKFLLFGWDAADWKVIRPLLDAGKMPSLKSVMEQGVSGNLATLDPPYSPMLWSSIATGKYADKHGILGFVEPDPVSKHIRPVQVTSRKTRAIWNILGHQGYKTNVFSWWPSHPAEPLNGMSVSNLFHKANKPSEKWPLLGKSVYPEDLSQLVAQLRIHPSELTRAHILPFIPDAAKIDQEEMKGLETFAKILAECASVHAVSTWGLENKEWDFTAIYHDAIDHFSHSFMKFHPPKLPGLPDEVFNLYKDVINGAYIFHDMMLDRLLQLIDDDTYLMIISDHGFQSDHLRPLKLPKEPAAPALEHRPFGIFCLKGPGIKKNETIYGASLLDIAPTILQIYDLPVGKDMDGVVLHQIFEKVKPSNEIESWDKISGNFFEHDPSETTDPVESKEAVQQLIDLGYIEDPGDDVKAAAEKVERELQYNLSRMYLGSGRASLAIPILEKLQKEAPESRFLKKLLSAYKNTGNTDASLAILKELKKGEDNSENSVKLIEASLLLDQGKNDEALTVLSEIANNKVVAPNIYIELGRCYLKLESWDNAKEAFNKAALIDPDKAAAYHGLGLVALRLKNYEEAVDHILRAIGLIFQFPLAHYHLGEALYHLNELQASYDAFLVAQKMNPGIAGVKNWLIKIASEADNLDLRDGKNALLSNNQFDQAENLNMPFKVFSGKTKGEIIIVSGLPRSGTSMMMQMLSNGGIDAFTDEKRKADADNPKGYLEHEAIKSIRKNKKWLKQAVGKSAKVIAHLLTDLPATYAYKVIFMERDLNEVLTSQHKMLVNLGKAKANTFPIALETNFKKVLDQSRKWAERQQNVEILYLNYAEVLKNPQMSTEQIQHFLGKEMDLDAMCRVVDKSLYRNKI